MEGDGYSPLDRAIMLAVRAHRGDTDKAGAPYVLHPLRVMARMTTDEERIAAVLHDTVEDSGNKPDPVTFGELEQVGIPAAALEALRLLTRDDDGSEEAYAGYIEKVAATPIARAVKLADLEDNLDTRRLREVTERDAKRITKYLKTYRRLRARE
jgi:(p)ppGpp synthase/HD superfamily hydrolase